MPCLDKRQAGSLAGCGLHEVQKMTSKAIPDVCSGGSKRRESCWVQALRSRGARLSLRGCHSYVEPWRMGRSQDAEGQGRAIQGRGKTVQGLQVRSGLRGAHRGMRTLICGMWNLIPCPGIEPGHGAWSLSHWTTREVPLLPLLKASHCNCKNYF